MSIQILITEALLHTKVIHKVGENSQFRHNGASTACHSENDILQNEITGTQTSFFTNFGWA